MIAILRAITTTAVLYGVPALLLRDHLLAYPAAMLTLTLAGTGLQLLTNDRADLQLGWIIVGAGALFLAWLASARADAPQTGA